MSRPKWIACGLIAGCIVLFVVRNWCDFAGPTIEPRLIEGQAWCTASPLFPIVEQGEELRLAMYFTYFSAGRASAGSDLYFGVPPQGGAGLEYAQLLHPKVKLPEMMWWRITKDQPPRVVYEHHDDFELKEPIPDRDLYDQILTPAGKLRSEAISHPLSWLHSSFQRWDQFLDLDGVSWHSDYSKGWVKTFLSPGKKFLTAIGGRGSSSGYTTIEVFRRRDQRRMALLRIERCLCEFDASYNVSYWLSETEFLLIAEAEGYPCYVCRFEK
jgi:hypothetical protein